MDYTTMTVRVNPQSYIFQIEIDEYELTKLSEYKLLGMTFKKSKYQFLNDLSDVLRIEILRLLEQLRDLSKENEYDTR